ncbi:MAG TPA: metallophosphoesterase [Steroidobacteraceae bacterium]|jgi:Icc-related predicted phosphoesterase
MRLAAVGDLHVKKDSQGKLQPLLTSVNERADILLLCGDLTDYGLEDEARVLAAELKAAVRVPIVAVLGNHDYECGQPELVTRILTDAGVTVLNGEAVEIQGLGIAGAKGFAGGFGRATLGAWGEPATKRFVQEAMDEALKLEGALARLRTEERVALLHYSPIRATVEGEPLEIFPYLGSSRLEEPLNRHPVRCVFHGHAHHGALEGKTSAGTTVYNVAMPLLLRSFPNQPPLRFVTLPPSPPSETVASMAQSLAGTPHSAPA